MAPNRTEMLYSASLEKHMSAYMKEIQQQAINEQYQLAQAKVVRESERMMLSQAETMARLDKLKADLISKAATEGKTKDIKIRNFVGNKGETTKEATKETTPSKKSFKESAPKALSLQAITEGKKNLKKTPSPEKKTKAKPPFQQELESAVLKRAPSEKKPKAKSPGSSKSPGKAISPTASEASTVLTMGTTEPAGSPKKMPDPNSENNWKKVQSEMQIKLEKAYTAGRMDDAEYKKYAKIVGNTYKGYVKAMRELDSKLMAGDKL